MRQPPFHRAGVAIAILALAWQGCVGDDPAAASRDDREGIEGAPCYPNGSCNAGLRCASNVCVGLDGGSSGGGDTDAATVCTQGTACGDACVVLAEADEHCGHCGHSCLGGKCVAGVCQPVLLATAASAYGIAVDGSNVYFTQSRANGVVASVPKSGGSVVPIAAAEDMPSVLVVDATHIYFGTGNSVRKVPLGGGAIVEIATGTKYINDLFLDGTGGLYFSTSGGTVGVVPTSGGSSATFAASGAVGVTAFGTEVYWAQYASSGAIHVYSLGSDGVRIPNQNSPFDIVRSGDFLLWTNYSSPGAVMLWDARASAGAAPRPRIAGLVTPRSLAADATTVYVAATGDGKILMAPIEGTTPAVTLAQGQGSPYYVATDDKAVYWTNNGTGQVMKVAKP